MSGPPREASPEYSRADPRFRRPELAATTLRTLLFALGLGGCLLLVLADFSTLYEVRTSGATTATVAGHEQHNYALLLLGLAAVPMVIGTLRGARPAMATLAGLGLLALAIILVGGDLHDIHATGVAGQLYEHASAGPKSGFFEETLGVALLLVSGGGGLMLSARAPARALTPRDDALPRQAGE